MCEEDTMASVVEFPSILTRHAKVLVQEASHRVALGWPGARSMSATLKVIDTHGRDATWRFRDIFSIITTCIYVIILPMFI